MTTESGAGDDDQPQDDDGYELAVPFILCSSQNGPFDDEAFVAGFQCGEVDRALTVVAAAGGSRFTATVYTASIRQLELFAMNRGFPGVAVDRHDDTWSTVTFMSTADSPAP